MKKDISDEDLRQALARLDRFATLTDARFALPFTNIRFGLDALIGLIPIIGDFVSFVWSLYLFKEAQTLGLPFSVKAKMARNLVIDFVLGLIPVIGDIGDVGFRANLRNVKLIVEHIGAEQRKRNATAREEGKGLFWVLLFVVAVVVSGTTIFLLQHYF